jgi:uncharacterized iron-regulated membrane protein
VITFTGVVMAYRPVSDLIYKRPDNAATQAIVSPPSSGAKPLGPDALLVIAQNYAPRWKTVTLRLGGGRPRPPSPPAQNSAMPTPSNPGAARREGGENRPSPAQLATISVREQGVWSPVETIATTLQIDPYTGVILRKEAFSDYSSGRKFRALNLALHTGEVVGLPGQILAFLASVSGLILVYTGFALSWRRFFRKRAVSPPPLQGPVAETTDKLG